MIKLMDNDNIKDLVIIGSGPAGWTAATYASRALLSPVVLAGEQGGGQLMFTTDVENYPGFKLGIKGPDLMQTMRAQAERFGAKVIEKNATSIQQDGSHFNVFYDNAGSENLSTRAVIVATGAKANTLKLPGEDRLMGRGVGTCAVCDAPFYKGKGTVFVVGGGDSAMEESLSLAKFANQVILLVRSDTLKASIIMTNRVKNTKNIKIWYKSSAKSFIGDRNLEKVQIDREGKIEEISADGLFYAIGHTPETEFLKPLGIQTNEKGYIKTHINYGFGTLNQSTSPTDGQSTTVFYPTSTSLPGIFAAGDCVDPRYRQAITAAGYGCMAALDAEKWLLHH